AAGAEREPGVGVVDRTRRGTGGGYHDCRVGDLEADWDAGREGGDRWIGHGDRGGGCPGDCWVAWQLARRTELKAGGERTGFAPTQGRCTARGGERVARIRHTRGPSRRG